MKAKRFDIIRLETRLKSDEWGDIRVLVLDFGKESKLYSKEGGVIRI